MRINEILQQVIENKKKLETCSRHDFSEQIDQTATVFRRWRCIHCGGEVDGPGKHWYELGMEHGRSEIKQG